MSEETKAPEGAESLPPIVSLKSEPEVAEAAPIITPRETVVIRAEDVGEMPADIMNLELGPKVEKMVMDSTPTAETSISMPVEHAVPEASTDSKSDLKPYSLKEFHDKFVVCGQGGESLTIDSWENLLNVMLGIVGEGKLRASAAAQHQKCWTVNRNNGVLYIDAGFNRDNPTKLGYVITQKPWNSLSELVIQ